MRVRTEGLTVGEEAPRQPSLKIERVRIQWARLVDSSPFFARTTCGQWDGSLWKSLLLEWILAATRYQKYVWFHLRKDPPQHVIAGIRQDAYGRGHSFGWLIEAFKKKQGVEVWCGGDRATVIIWSDPGAGRCHAQQHDRIDKFISGRQTSKTI